MCINIRIHLVPTVNQHFCSHLHIYSDYLLSIAHLIGHQQIIQFVLLQTQNGDVAHGNEMSVNMF